MTWLEAANVYGAARFLTLVVDSTQPRGKTRFANIPFAIHTASVILVAYSLVWTALYSQPNAWHSQPILWSLCLAKKNKNECTKEEEKWSHPSLYCGAVAMKNNHKEDRWRREERKGGKMERGRGGRCGKKVRGRVGKNVENKWGESRRVEKKKERRFKTLAL